MKSGVGTARLRRQLPWVLALAALAAAATSGTGAMPARKPSAASAFARAEQMRATLAAKPEERRRRSEYRQVIAAFFEVYHRSPAYGKTPAALGEVAELKREMGSRFS